MWIAVSDDCLVNTDTIKCVTQIAGNIQIEFNDSTMMTVRGVSLTQLVKPLVVEHELNGEREE